MKKWLITIILILMIVAICSFVFTGNKTKNNGKNEIDNLEQNVILNEIVNENTIDENIVTDENEDNNEEAIQNTQTESRETLEEAPATAEQKAINIVKKDWKDSNNVSIDIQGMDENGSYVVVVRNSKTTEALAFYNVNISNGTFTKKELN